MRYTYPQVTTGYPWNLLQRCKNEVGIEPIGSANVEGQLILDFEDELTPEEKKKLDVLMNDDPAFPPKDTLKFKVVDLWEKLAEFNKMTGADLRIYYNESEPGSGVFDVIELHADGKLTPEQRETIKGEYAKLITEP